MKHKEIIDKYIRHQRSMNMAESTIAIKQAALTDFFNYLEETGVDSLMDVDMRIMLGYQAYLAKILNKHGQRYNPRTQNHRISTVRGLFHYMQRGQPGYIDGIAGIEMAKAPRPLPENILSLKETLALLNQPDVSHPLGLRDKAILEVLYSTGMRRAECVGLDLTDFNYEDRCILIRNAKGGRDRVVSMTMDAKRSVQAYIKDVRPRYTMDPEERAVFLNKYGARFGKQGLWMMVKRRARDAGIQLNISPHSIRHAIATHLTDAGCNIRYTQELLGHSSVNATCVYITVSAKTLKTAIRRYHPRGKALKHKITMKDLQGKAKGKR